MHILFAAELDELRISSRIVVGLYTAPLVYKAYNPGFLSNKCPVKSLYNISGVLLGEETRMLYGEKWCFSCCLKKIEIQKVIRLFMQFHYC